MFIPIAVGWQTGPPPQPQSGSTHTKSDLWTSTSTKIQITYSCSPLPQRLSKWAHIWSSELDDVRNPLGLMMIMLILTCWPCSIPEPGSGSSSHSPPMLLLWSPPSLAWVAPTEPFQCWWTGGRSGTDDPRPLTPGRAGCQGWKLVWREEVASQWKLITFSE